MKHLIRLMVICISLLPVLCQAGDTDYGYPITDPYGATVLGTPAGFKTDLPEKITIRRLVLEPISHTSKPDIFYYDDGVRCTFVRQDGKAPLIFIIAGTGAGDQSEKQLILMKAFHQAGFHVVTLPSPSHPNFIISASRSHIPGDLAEDAADLYWVMKNVWDRIKDDIQVSGFYLSGYSLGGTQAAFVSRLDEERKLFNFRKVLLLNPAVSLYDSMSRIEALLDGIPGGSANMIRFTNRMLDRFTEFYLQGQYVAFNDNFLYDAYASHVFSGEEAEGIIGVSFRLSSAAMIFSSDIMTNGGYVVPKNRVLSFRDDLSDYFRVSVHLSFLDYFNEYFCPYFLKKRPGLTREALIASQSLRSIEPYLKASTKLGVVTNADDFILSQDDLGYLKRLFGERARIYPHGGHMGNLEYRDNLAYTINFFKQGEGQ